MSDTDPAAAPDSGTIPVICDRCRITGVIGEGDFSNLGRLLDFEPVPVHPRVNGWSPDAQRAFVAALSATGSKRRAATSIGRNAYGIDQLLKRPDSASLKAAIDCALAIAEANGSMKIAQGVADAAARNAQLTPPSRLRGLPPPEPEPEDEDSSDERKFELIASIGAKFMRKVAAEREARLNGEIVAADFYLRQITIMEVLLDLSAQGAGERAGEDARELLRDLRRGRHGIFDLVSTELSDWLDASRREWWAQEDEPERPTYPDTRFLERRQSAAVGYAIYADQNGTGAASAPARGFTQEQWAAMDDEDQRAARQRQFDEDAEEQREWEAQAHRDYGERRA